MPSPHQTVFSQPVGSLVRYPRILLALRPTLRRREYEHALRSDGFHVRAANHGIECLEELRTAQPDVLVIEPELCWGGAEGVLALLHEELSHDISVLVLISDVDWSGTWGISHFRIDDLAVQPLSPERLVRRMRRLAFSRLIPTA
jgi:DNA-binding response OmpR family regulator